MTPQSAICNPQSSIVVIVGPTAAGKTDLAIELAGAWAARSSPPTRARSIAAWTSAPPKQPAEQRAACRTTCWMSWTPIRSLTLAEYQRMAYHAIADVQARGLPASPGRRNRSVCSGSDRGLADPGGRPRPGAASRAGSGGGQAGAPRRSTLGWPAWTLAAAARIDYRNVRRVIRALEVCLVTGRPIT